MNKEIRYTGYTAAPSDYDCADGQLAHCLNLLNEDGALRPLFPPKRLITLPDTGRVVYIHRTSAYMHYIIHDAESLSLLWLDPAAEDAVSLGVFPSVMQVAGIGNTLIVLTPAGMRYFLWKPDLGGYADLGGRIPMPEVSFALGKEAASEGDDTFTVTLDIPEDLRTEVVARWKPQGAGSGASRPHPSASLYRSPQWRALVADATTAVLAGLNKYVADAQDDGLFTEPFFVRYALRLFDGSHVMHSAPVLMIPNSASPVLPYTAAGDDSDSVFSVSTTIIHERCALLLRFIEGDLSGWEDIVTHVDFFVTPPVYTYDQSGEVCPGRTSATIPEGKFTHSGTGVTHVSVRPSRADAAAAASVTFGSGCRETSLTIPSGMEWNVGRRTASEIADALVSQQASLYYLVSSVEVSKVARMDAYARLDMGERSLRNLVTRTRLEDDYQSHHTLIPSIAHVYNSRLNLAGIELRPFGGFALRTMTAAWIVPDGEMTPFCPVRVYVRLRRDGRSVWVAADTPQTAPYTLGEDYFPRWIFYPDSSATEMLIVEYVAGGGVSGCWRIPLSAHDFLEGASWSRGMGPELPEHLTGEAASAAIPEPGDPVIDMPSKLYTSEVGNPFFFPVTGINTVGTGRIIGLASAAKALSQGQFGQFPLYAFTDEGVWALEVSSTGGYSAKQPISRDVCLSRESITQIDSAVLFATDRGIMLISGSQTQCITDVLNAPDYFDFAGLPGLVNICNVVYPDCTFPDYIRGCRMAYDYVGQRIVVFNPAKDYAYVYSLRTKLWGMQGSRLQSVVNAYPQAYAMARDDDGNALVDLSRTDAEEASCLLVSRPLKLDGPDVLKTVTTVMQRGLLPKGRVDTALYGTRDYFSWHLVGSSRGRGLRTFRGTPYKAFRIVSVGTLRQGETIAGCSLEVTPRMTDRLR